MSQPKKHLLTVVAALLSLHLLYFWGPGLFTRGDMASASDNIVEVDQTIAFRAVPMSSHGNARSCKADYSGSGAYLTFYCAFGGPNGSYCSTYDFTIHIPEGCTEVYFPRGNDTFQKIFVKDPDSGLWHNLIKENIRVPAP